ncbi:MAG TPA: VWA domain-containing protein [Anaerolineales bacterium]|nr:VWA domain-containing protein [Anaerolineales bacterium]
MKQHHKLLALTLALGTLLSLGWTPVQPQADAAEVRVTQVDRSRFPEVTVYISVTDAQGEPVPVSPAQLAIAEDGVAVEPSSIEGAQPVDRLTTLLVMDISGSMAVAGKLEAAKAAAKAYVEQMRDDDQAGLVSFNVEVEYVQPITGDRRALNAAIDGLQAHEDTAMYDALAEANRILTPIEGRKAVIVLTDGMDNSSAASMEEVLSGIGPAGLSISTIGLGDVRQVGVSFEGLDETSLSSLAARAGGVYEAVQDPSTLVGIYERFGRSLQHEYAITYVSPGAFRDGVNRTVTVSLAGASAGTKVYNPGGVVPEVPQQAAWTIFGVGMLVLLALLIVPAGIAWILRRAPARAGAPSSRPGRIRLQDELPASAQKPTETRIRLRS